MHNLKKQMNIGLMPRPPILVSILALTMFLLVGCSVTPSPSPKREKIEFRRFGVHVVKFEEETPSLVSAWYTDSPKNWVQFFVLKRSKSLSNYLPIGSEVFIPVKLLKNNAPIPENFVRDWREKNGTPKNSSKKKIRPSTVNSIKNEDQTEENSIESIDNDELIENLVGVE